MLKVFLPLQILFIPALLILLAWGVYRTVLRKDRAIGLALYMGLVIIVDNFMNTGIYLPVFESGSIRYSEICAFFLIFNDRSRKQIGENRQMMIFFSLYSILLVLSCFTSLSIGDGITDLRRIVFPQLIAFWVSYKGFRNEEDYNKFLFYFTILIIIISLFTFWDLFFDRWLLKSDMLYKPEYWMNRQHGRYGSYFLNPNYMGAFSVLVSFAILVSVTLEKVTWKKIFRFVGLLALIFAFVETQSRGPILSFIVGLVFFLMIPSQKYRFTTKIASIGALVVVLLLFMPGFIEHALDRFISIEKETSGNQVSRYSVWSYTIKLIGNNPLIGIGIGEKNYLIYMEKYGFVDVFGQRSLDNPHNSYLQLAVYAGIPAVLVFILVNWQLFKRGLKAIIKHKESGHPVLLVGFLAGLAAFLASLVTDMYLFTQVAVVYWTFFGLAFSMVNTLERAQG